MVNLLFIFENYIEMKKMSVERLTRLLNNKGWIVFQSLDLPKKYVFKSRTTSINNLHYVKRNSSLNLLNADRFYIRSNTLRQFHAVPNYIYYAAVETNYARNVLSNSEDYSNSLATSLSSKDLQIDEVKHLLEENWNEMNNTEILNNFELLSHYIIKSQETTSNFKHERILEALANRCSGFSDKELYHLLNCMELWNISENAYMYKSFWKIIDNECLRRMENWTIDETLLMNDYFSKINLLKISEFPKYSLEKVDLRKMTPANLVQLTYLMRANPRIIINLRKLEECLEKCANKLTIEELGIVATAFFTRETKIKSKNFILIFMQKLMNNINNVSDISFTTILKILRYSVDLATMRHFDILIGSLIDQIPERNLITLTNIAHMQAKLLLHNKQLFSTILNRVEKDVHNARLKDVERLLFATSIFNYQPETTPFYSAAMKSLLDPCRSEEIERFPHALVYSVMYMLQQNCYPEETLKRIMEHEFINKVCKGNVRNLDREYIFLDYCIEIDHPEYDGPRLKKYLRNYLLRNLEEVRQKQKKQKFSQIWKLTTEVAHVCKQTIGSDSAVYIDYPLPHFLDHNIIICYNPKTNRFLPPEKHFDQSPLGAIKYAPNDGNKWFALIIGTHNIMTRNTYEPSGILAVRIRHLQRIGYKPVVIFYIDWQNLEKTSRKCDFIREILKR